VTRHPEDTRWSALLERYRGVTIGAKQTALLRLLTQNPAEKKMVFVHHRDSLGHLADLLRGQQTAFALFDGAMSGPAKDAAVDAFRADAPVLLCSESGGEGRNLQFCNTLINFDIPWNPMAIEQRIGRIDRIGQTREVFVFNLVTTGTIEDEVLRILDEKINMFELVVGEVGAILGEFEDQHDFSTLVLDAWLRSSEEARSMAFVELEGQLVAARRQYDEAKALDEARADLLAMKRDSAIALHCHHGIRSRAAAENLVREGFTDVYNLEGGIDAWSQEVDPSVPRY